MKKTLVFIGFLLLIGMFIVGYLIITPQQRNQIGVASDVCGSFWGKVGGAISSDVANECKQAQTVNQALSIEPYVYLMGFILLIVGLASPSGKKEIHGGAETKQKSKKENRNNLSKISNVPVLKILLVLVIIIVAVLALITITTQNVAITTQNVATTGTNAQNGGNAASQQDNASCNIWKTTACAGKAGGTIVTKPSIQSCSCTCDGKNIGCL